MLRFFTTLTQESRLFKINPRYLLVLACSQRKRAGDDLLPAIDRYDGGSYRVLRKAMRGKNWHVRLDILIVSAKYGLIEASTLIENYDQRMSGKRAKELQEQVLHNLRLFSQQHTYHQVYVDLGKAYLPAIGDLAPLFASSSVVYAEVRLVRGWQG